MRLLKSGRSLWVCERKTTHSQDVKMQSLLKWGHSGKRTRLSLVFGAIAVAHEYGLQQLIIHHALSMLPKQGHELAREAVSWCSMKNSSCIASGQRIRWSTIS